MLKCKVTCGLGEQKIADSALTYTCMEMIKLPDEDCLVLTALNSSRYTMSFILRRDSFCILAE